MVYGHIWDPMPELTITSPFVHSIESTSTYLPWAGDRVDLSPMPESTLSPSHGLWIWPQIRLYMGTFGLFFYEDLIWKIPDQAETF
jgi:hypothetical protein